MSKSTCRTHRTAAFCAIPSDARTAKHRAVHAQIQRTLGRTTPMPTVRCFQIRFQLAACGLGQISGKRWVKSSTKSSKEPWRFLFNSSIARPSRILLALYWAWCPANRADSPGGKRPRAYAGPTPPCTCRTGFVLTERIDQNGGVAVVVAVRTQPHEVVGKHARDFADITRMSRARCMSMPSNFSIARQ